MADDKWVPEYKIKVDGKEMPADDRAHLQQILVDLRRQSPASVELQFNNHEGDFDDRPEYAPGAAVEVAMGYTISGTEVVFTGEIIGNQVKLAENAPRLFIVRAFDHLHRMTRGRKTRTFLDEKFSDIVTTVATDSSLSPEVDDTAFVREYVIQHNQTDFDFVRGIAGWLDFDLHVRHREGANTLRFKTPEVTGEAIVTAIYEKPNVEGDEVHLRRFDGRLSLARVVSEVTVRGWNPAEKKEIVGKKAELYGSMGGESPATDEIREKWGETDRQIVDYKVFSQEEADKIAETKVNEYARTFIKADIELRGHVELQPGTILKVERVGPRFDGKYFIEQVTHRFISKVLPRSGYTSTVRAARCDW